MADLLQDIRVSTRSLLARPVFAAVAVMTIALGIGATTALFSVVHGVLLRPLAYRDAERLVTLWQTGRDNPGPNIGGTISHVNFLDWKRTATSFEAQALYTGSGFVVTGLGEAELVPGGLVTPDFFKVMGATPVMGREFTPADDRPNGPRVIVVSHGFWKDRLGGRPDVIGSALEISSRQYEIVGVAPAGFAFPSNARVWGPVQNDDANCGRGCVYLNGIARLASGASVESARDEMRAIASALERQFPNSNTNVTVGVTTLRDQIVGDVRTALWMLFAAVVMVLLIACANVANLLLVRGAARQSEIAVRAALGASRLRLVRFLMIESAVLAVTGAGLGVLVAWWGVDALRQLSPADIPRVSEIGYSGVTFFFALAIATATALLFGLGPAIQLMKTPLVSLIGSRGDATNGPARWSRTFLLVVEVSLAVILLVGAGLLLRSMSQLQRIQPGWTSEGITIFNLTLPAARYRTTAEVIRGYNEIAERLQAIPGVTRVARISGLPLGPSENVQTFTRTDKPAPPPGQAPSALYRIVDADYFATVQIPVIAGRTFDDRDRQGAQPVVVISREMADEFWRGEDPIGKAFDLDNVVLTIVGVVAGVRSSNFLAQPQPEMYVPHAQAPTRSLTILLASTQPSAHVLNAARQAIRGIDDRLPLIRPGTFAALESRAVARPRFYLLLLGLFALLALALAAVGVYGVVAYLVSQRTREIGIRVALGARTVEVLRLVIWQGLRPGIAGIALGLFGAVVAGRVLSTLLYQVTPTDPMTLMIVISFLLIVVLLACVIPALRAARIPAAIALRSE